MLPAKTEKLENSYVEKKEFYQNESNVKLHNLYHSVKGKFSEN